MNTVTIAPIPPLAVMPSKNGLPEGDSIGHFPRPIDGAVRLSSAFTGTFLQAIQTRLDARHITCSTSVTIFAHDMPLNVLGVFNSAGADFTFHDGEAPCFE